MAIPYHINLLLATSGQQRMEGGGGAWGHRPALISIRVGDPLLCTLRYFNLRYWTRLPMRGLVLVALNASRNIH